MGLVRKRLWYCNMVKLSHGLQLEVIAITSMGETGDSEGLQRGRRSRRQPRNSEYAFKFTQLENTIA